MYDIGFPFLRSWLYGLGGFIVVVAAFAMGLVFANGRRQPTEVANSAPIVSDEFADDVIVVRPNVDVPHFPAFAPEGVIVVRPPERPEPAYAAAEPTLARSAPPRASVRRRAEAVERANASREAPPPLTSARQGPIAEPAERAPVEPDQDIQPTQNAAPPAQEDEDTQYADNEFSEPEADTRSWYGSTEYWREVRARQRAEREARRSR